MALRAGRVGVRPDQVDAQGRFKRPKPKTQNNSKSKKKEVKK